MDTFTKKRQNIPEQFEQFCALAEKYGFKAKCHGDIFVLQAKNTDGCWINWIECHPIRKKVVVVGNTDNCNLWLCDTRKDLTAERITAFVRELNAFTKHTCDTTCKLRVLIDPEDWQEIANIADASTDERYTNN